MSSPLTDARVAIRRAARLARMALPSDMRTLFSEQIRAHIVEGELWKCADTVALYVPVGSEVDLWPLVDLALASGRSVVIPRIVGDDLTTDRVMTFDRLRTDNVADLILGPHHIPETPEPDPVLSTDISLVLMPATAIDAQGNRLGGGVGYYDRWLAGARSMAPQPRTLATIFQAQFVAPPASIPAESHDQRVEAVVTETGFTQFA